MFKCYSCQKLLNDLKEVYGSRKHRCYECSTKKSFHKSNNNLRKNLTDEQILKVKWSDMKSRCKATKSPKTYKNYFLKGIKVCEEWLDFDVFKNDVLKGFKRELSLDRIDNNKGYSKDNCRWVTIDIQRTHRRYSAHNH
tara:strand:+ start:6163 stop:6579 length:417 start_codon:yes stop_codon:yes gene_type:complete